MPPKPRGSDGVSAQTAKATARTEDEAKALASFRRHRIQLQFRRSQEDAYHRCLLSQQITSKGLQGEAAFRLMGSQRVGSQSEAFGAQASQTR